MDPARLLASKCPECGATFFPRRSRCRNPGCSRQELIKIELASVGVVRSFTVQHYLAPLPFRLDPDLMPYGVLLVDFPEGVRVLGMLHESVAPIEISIGMTVEVAVGRLVLDGDAERVTWKFAPPRRASPAAEVKAT